MTGGRMAGEATRTAPGAEEARRAAMAGARDPFALELVKNALATLADEMALTVSRTARSFVVKEALDFSTALFLADGEMIAQGTCLPFHLGAMPFAVRSVLRQFGGTIAPGDLPGTAARTCRTSSWLSRSSPASASSPSRPRSRT